jgi:hypothetical protein
MWIAAIPDKSKSGGIYVQVKRGNVPGPGLARPRVANPIYVQRDYPTWVNTDLAFLSSITCATLYEAPATLTSLAGLDNVVDGVRVDGGNAMFYFRESPNLTNLSALNAYGPVACRRNVQTSSRARSQSSKYKAARTCYRRGQPSATTVYTECARGRPVHRGLERARHLFHRWSVSRHLHKSATQHFKNPWFSVPSNQPHLAGLM